MSFFGTLLRAKAQDQSWFYSRQFPAGLFRDQSALATWIYDYRERLGRYPSIKITSARFPKADLSMDPDDTVQTSLQGIIDSELFRQMSKVVSESKKRVDDGSSMSDVLEFMRGSVQSLESFTVESSDIDSHGSTALSRYKQRVRDRRNGPSFLFKPTPWPTINKLIGFIRPGQHVILVGRTSMGKTWIGINWAEYISQNGGKVLFITKEMPSEDCDDRFISLRHRFNHSQLLRGTLPPKELRRWVDIQRAARPAGRLLISGKETVDGTDLGHVHQKISETKPDFVVIDGAYLFYPKSLAKSAGDVQRFQYISNSLKRLAKLHRVVLVSVIQGNREGEKKGDGPTQTTLANIYGADAWAQDADYALILNGRRGLPDGRTLEVAKGRESGLGSANILFRVDPPSFHETFNTQAASSSASALSDPANDPSAIVPI